MTTHLGLFWPRRRRREHDDRAGLRAAHERDEQLGRAAHLRRVRGRARRERDAHVRRPFDRRVRQLLVVERQRRVARGERPAARHGRQREAARDQLEADRVGHVAVRLEVELALEVHGLMIHSCNCCKLALQLSIAIAQLLPIVGRSARRGRASKETHTHMRANEQPHRHTVSRRRSAGCERTTQQHPAAAPAVHTGSPDTERAQPTANTFDQRPSTNARWRGKRWHAARETGITCAARGDGVRRGETARGGWGGSGGGGARGGEREHRARDDDDRR